jgi:hypothetical protein
MIAEILVFDTDSALIERRYKRDSGDAMIMLAAADFDRASFRCTGFAAKYQVLPPHTVFHCDGARATSASAFKTFAFRRRHGVFGRSASLGRTGGFA